MTDLHLDVLIIGAGISGIGMACYLRREMPHKNFQIFEGRDAIGGTWDLFKYPGIRSDSDMFTFGYQFRPWDKEKEIAPAEDILNYLKETIAEYDLEKHIHFRHMIKKISWSSVENRWSVHMIVDNKEKCITTDFLVTCTGYYRYDQGYLPEFPNEQSYKGMKVHPQHWPENLDYRDKNVLVIGSGATAVTLVPAMAGIAKHVTMLQRSPTYIFNRPSTSWQHSLLKSLLPGKLGHRFIRWKNTGLQSLFIKLCQKYPNFVRRLIRKQVIKALDGSDAAVQQADIHFNPSYNPWEQRLCLVPDADLFQAIRQGEASVVTDHIDHFTETGVKLKSGTELSADIIVTATGLNVSFMHGVEIEKDDKRFEPCDLVSYKGIMFANMPNMMSVFGYTGQSWTLKVDIAGEYLINLLKHMERGGFHRVDAPLDVDDTSTLKPVMNRLALAGYVRRAVDRLPKQLPEEPWIIYDHYQKDRKLLLNARFDDGSQIFSKRQEPENG